MKHIINKIKRFKIIVFFFKLISPGFGRCGVCGLPWNRCNEKSVNTTQFSGTFSTCQYCWDHSSFDLIKKSYSKTYDQQYYSLIKMNMHLGTNEKMSHSKEHLLKCVETEYNKETIKRRKQKIQYLKKRTKKNKNMNVTLYQQN